MTNFPASLVWVGASDVPKPDIVRYMEERIAVRFADADDLRGLSPDFNQLVYIADILYGYDSADIVSADDLSDFPAVIVTANNRRYKPVEPPGSPQFMGNAIINGGVDIWQRGPGPFTTSVYAADRFLLAVGTGATCSVDRRVGLTDDAEFSLGFDRSVTGSTASQIQQRIEGVRTFSGETVTISFDAQSQTGGNMNVDTSFVQNFGSGGSGQVVIGNQANVITPAVQRFTHTVDILSVAGKTIGANNYIALRFIRGTGQPNGEVRFGNIKVERGRVATPFSRRPASVEMDMAERYFQKSYNFANPPGAITGFGAILEAARGTFGLYTRIHKLHRRMRAAPTVTFYSTVTGATGMAADLTAAADVAVLASSISEAQIEVNGNGNFVINNNYAAQWTADAEL